MGIVNEKDNIIQMEGNGKLIDSLSNNLKVVELQLSKVTNISYSLKLQFLLSRNKLMRLKIASSSSSLYKTVKQHDQFDSEALGLQEEEDDTEQEEEQVYKKGKILLLGGEQAIKDEVVKLIEDFNNQYLSSFATQVHSQFTQTVSENQGHQEKNEQEHLIKMKIIQVVQDNITFDWQFIQLSNESRMEFLTKLFQPINKKTIHRTEKILKNSFVKEEKCAETKRMGGGEENDDLEESDDQNLVIFYIWDERTVSIKILEKQLLNLRGKYKNSKILLLKYFHAKNQNDRLSEKIYSVDVYEEVLKLCKIHENRIFQITKKLIRKENEENEEYNIEGISELHNELLKFTVSPSHGCSFPNYVKNISNYLFSLSTRDPILSMNQFYYLISLSSVLFHSGSHSLNKLSKAELLNSIQILYSSSNLFCFYFPVPNYEKQVKYLMRKKSISSIKLKSLSTNSVSPSTTPRSSPLTAILSAEKNSPTFKQSVAPSKPSLLANPSGQKGNASPITNALSALRSSLAAIKAPTAASPEEEIDDDEDEVLAPRANLTQQSLFSKLSSGASAEGTLEKIEAEEKEKRPLNDLKIRKKSRKSIKRKKSKGDVEKEGEIEDEEEEEMIIITNQEIILRIIDGIIEIHEDKINKLNQGSEGKEMKDDPSIVTREEFKGVINKALNTSALDQSKGRAKKERKIEKLIFYFVEISICYEVWIREQEGARKQSYLFPALMKSTIPFDVKAIPANQFIRVQYIQNNHAKLKRNYSDLKNTQEISNKFYKVRLENEQSLIQQEEIIKSIYFQLLLHYWNHIQKFQFSKNIFVISIDCNQPKNQEKKENEIIILLTPDSKLKIINKQRKNEESKKIISEIIYFIEFQFQEKLKIVNDKGIKYKKFQISNENQDREEKEEEEEMVMKYELECPTDHKGIFKLNFSSFKSTEHAEKIKKVEEILNKLLESKFCNRGCELEYSIFDCFVNYQFLFIILNFLKCENQYLLKNNEQNDNNREIQNKLEKIIMKIENFLPDLLDSFPFDSQFSQTENQYLLEHFGNLLQNNQVNIFKFKQFKRNKKTPIFSSYFTSLPDSTLEHKNFLLKMQFSSQKKNQLKNKLENKLDIQNKIENLLQNYENKKSFSFGEKSTIFSNFIRFPLISYFIFDKNEFLLSKIYLEAADIEESVKKLFDNQLVLSKSGSSAGSPPPPTFSAGKNANSVSFEIMNITENFHSFFDFIKLKKFEAIKNFQELVERLFLFLQICYGIRDLQNLKIILREFKLENLYFIPHNNFAFISDDIFTSYFIPAESVNFKVKRSDFSIPLQGFCKNKHFTPPEFLDFIQNENQNEIALDKFHVFMISTILEEFIIQFLPTFTTMDDPPDIPLESSRTQPSVSDNSQSSSDSVANDPPRENDASNLLPTGNTADTSEAFPILSSILIELSKNMQSTYENRFSLEEVILVIEYLLFSIDHSPFLCKLTGKRIKHNRDIFESTIIEYKRFWHLDNLVSQSISSYIAPNTLHQLLLSEFTCFSFSFDSIVLVLELLTKRLNINAEDLVVYLNTISYLKK